MKIAPNSIVEEGAVLGEGTMVWYFSHIMKGARIGQNCTIGDRVFIGSGVIIGDNVKIANGVNIYSGAIIKDNVFIGNNVSFTNARYPRAWRKANKLEPIIVEENATINAGAIIVGGVIIGKGSAVGEGAVVLRNVSEGGFVVSPAADCICGRDTCLECIKRKEKNFKKEKYGKPATV